MRSHEGRAARARRQPLYEGALQAQPTLAGTISTTLTIHQGGRITDVHATANTTGSASVAACVEGVVRTALPEIADGPASGTRGYTYDFVFAPAPTQ